MSAPFLSAAFTRVLVSWAAAGMLASLPTTAWSQERAGRAPASHPSIESMARTVVTIQVVTDSGPSLGSGVVLEPTGVIATAAHVIQGARSGYVQLTDGQRLTVEGLLDVDETLDLALLRVAGFGLPAPRLGNSDSVTLGQRLIAIGTPMGLATTVADGLLSSVRTVNGVRRLQISVPVSPGSSGGPVFAETGELIGIVISGIRGDGAEGLNFALPVNAIRGRLELSRSKSLVPLGRALAARAADAPASGGARARELGTRATPLIDDDFQGARVLPLGNDAGCIYVYTAEGYQVTNNRTLRTCPARYPGAFPASVRIETAFSVLRGSLEKIIWIGFGGYGGSRYYTFSILPASRFQVLQHEPPDRWRVVLPPTATHALAPVSSTNHLAVEIRGAEVTLFINDAEVGTFTAVEPVAGEVVLESDDKMTVLWRYLRVMQLGSPGT